MKKLISSLLLFALINLFIQPSYSKTVKVKASTPVEITISETISSKDAVEGQKIPIVIDNDVVIDGVKIFKNGGKGYVVISEVSKRGYWGKGGEILINRGKVYDVNGNEHRIEISKLYEGKETTWSVVLATFGLATIILCPLGLFAFVKGKDAQTKIDVSIETILLDEFNFQTK